MLCTTCNAARSHAERRAELAKKRLVEAGLLDGALSHMTLESFKADTKHLDAAHTTISQWLYGWPYSHGESVLLWSQGYGVGKTHLARAAQRWLISIGAAVVFFMVADLLAAIRETYDKGSQASEEQILHRARYADLLILDDLGKEHVTDRGRPWFHDLIFRIVDRRYRDGASLLITSNEAPDRLPGLIGGATTSRLYEMLGSRMVDMSGPDWRLR